MASSAHERMGRSHPGLGGDTVGGGCSYEELPCITHRHLLPRYRCPAVPLPAGGARPAGSPQEDGPGRLQQREGSCMTIQYNLSPFPLPSSRGDGYCLIPFDSSFIICLPPSSFPVVPPRLLCGRNQSLVSDDCLGGREGKDSRVRVARPLGGGGAREHGLAAALESCLGGDGGIAGCGCLCCAAPAGAAVGGGTGSWTGWGISSAGSQIGLSISSAQSWIGLSVPSAGSWPGLSFPSTGN